MTTAEALEGITDAGEFEILAIRVLRVEDEDCRLLEHLGVNATGKTIPSPIDGFCLVPGSKPPRFITAAFTTFKPRDLRRKWLFDHAQAPNAKQATPKDDGDLVKAAHHAEALRKEYPGAEFIVHLCSNRRLHEKLMGEVYQKAEEMGLRVVFLGQSRIRDCLDMKPEGQWLRKEHLGIQAEQLSLSLLKCLSKESLRSYSQEFFITSAEHFVSTATQQMLGKSIRQEDKAAYIVSGISGSGKSVISYQIMREHVESGGIGLWIPGEAAARANSLAEAVETTLRTLYPAIQNGAGAIALGLVSPQHPLLLVVDDVNRSGDPTTTIRKLVTWAKPLTSTETKENDIPPSRLSVVIPVWDVFWAPLDPMYKSFSWLNRIPLRRMSEDEAVRCLQGALGEQADVFADTQLRQLVETLSYDPILIAMFADLFRNGPRGNVDVLTHEVMERFISAARAEAASSGTYIEADFQEALRALALSMLRHRELHPRWADITSWLTGQQAGAVRQLVTVGKICRVTEHSGERRFEFRHDRILEYHLADAAAAMLKEPGEHINILSDPFYVTFLGRAIAMTAVPKQTVSWFRTNSPLALVAAIRFLNPVNDAIANSIVNDAKSWLSAAACDTTIPSAILYESYRLLEGTDSPFVLEITASLSLHRSLCHARLANGDAIAGAQAFTDQRWFLPAVNDPYLDSILERALRQHRHILITDCKQMLERSDLRESERIGALTLAGFIGADELANSIRIAWDSAPNKTDILLAALWAGLRCAGQSPAELLDPMLHIWSSLPEERSNGSLSERAAVAEELRFAMRRGISESVLRYLVDTATRNETVRYAIAYLLQQVDNPVAVRYLVMLAADMENQAKKKGGISPWSMTLQDNWDPTRDLGHRLSAESLSAIQMLWESPESAGWLKERAFNFWVKATDDLATLRIIPPEHPHFKTALRRRALLGDFTAIPHVKSILPSDAHWFHVVAHIWCAEFSDATDHALLTLREQTPTDFTGGQTNAHYMLARLLRDIPGENAEKLLVGHWDYLRYSRLFVQVALYLGTEQCTTLANMALQNWPREVDPFTHLGMFFGFCTYGLRDRLCLAHLQTLQPHLKRLNNHTIADMAAFCMGYEYREWADRYLRPEFDRRRAKLEHKNEEQDFIERVGCYHFPSDIDLIEKLDWIESQQHHESHIWQWCEEFDQRQDDPSRWRRILEQWLDRSPSLARLKIVGNAILRKGSRQDLQLLTKYPSEGPQEQVEGLLANVRFAVMQKSLT